MIDYKKYFPTSAEEDYYAFAEEKLSELKDYFNNDHSALGNIPNLIDKDADRDKSETLEQKNVSISVSEFVDKIPTFNGQNPDSNKQYNLKGLAPFSQADEPFAILLISEIPTHDENLRNYYYFLLLSMLVVSIRLDGSKKSKSVFKDCLRKYKKLFKDSQSLRTIKSDISLNDFYRSIKGFETDLSHNKKKDNPYTVFRRLTGMALAKSAGVQSHSKDMPKKGTKVITYPGMQLDELDGAQASTIATQQSTVTDYFNIPKEEMDDLPDPNSHYWVSTRPRKNSFTAISPSLQSVHNKSFSRQVVRNNLYLACSFNTLTLFEFDELKKSCLKNLKDPKVPIIEKQNIIVLLLVAISGKPENDFANLKFRGFPDKSRYRDSCWVKDNSNLYHYSPTQIPSIDKPKEMSDEDAAIFCSKPKSYGTYLAIPKILQPYIEQLLNGSDNTQDLFPINIHESLTELKKKNTKLKRITYSRLVNFFPSFMTRSGIDPVVTTVVCNLPKIDNAGIYYSFFQGGLIPNFHSELMSIFNLPTNFNLQPNTTKLDNYPSGSVLVPSQNVVKITFETVRKELIKAKKQKDQSLKGLVYYHNLLTYYTYMTLSLCTGHRPVKTPFESLSDFDLKSAYLFLSDKAVRENETSRIIPIANIGIEQFLIYLDHLEPLKKKLNYINSAIGLRVNDIFEDNASPLFILNEDLEPIDLDPKYMKIYQDNILSLPLNWTRHFLRSYFIDPTKFNYDATNAFMGHSSVGFGTLSSRSGFNFSQFNNVKKELNSLFKKMEILPSEPCPPSKKKGLIDRFFKPYKKPENSYRSSLRGREAREEKRLAGLNTIKLATKGEIIKLGFNPDQIKTFIQYNKTLDSLELFAKNLCETSHEYRDAIEIIHSHSFKILKQNPRILGSLPVLPQRIPYDSSFRSESWFYRVRDIHIWNQQFIKKLKALSSRKNQLELKKLVGLLLYSAITRGGLANHKILTPFVDTILGNNPSLEIFNELSWIDIKHRSFNMSYNYLDEEGVSHVLKRWFPDTISLGLLLKINKFNKNEKEKFLQEILKLKLVDGSLEKITEKQGIATSLFENIESSIFETVGTTNIKKLNHITNSAFWATETIEDIPISETLQGIAKGNFSNFSMDQQSWLNLIGAKPKNTPPQASSKPSSQPEYKSTKSDVITIMGDRNWGKLLEEDFLPIWKKHSEEKITHLEVIKRLKYLRSTILANKENEYPTFVYLLIDWLIELSETGNASTSTARYFSTIYHVIKISAIEISEEKLDIHNPDNLQSFYTRLFEHRLEKSEKEAFYLLARLKQLHEYGMRTPGYDLPSLPDMEWGSINSVVSFVRTKFISYQDYEIVKEKIRATARSTEEADKLELFITFGYRLGMRIEEIAKLLISEIEPSDEKWIRVCANIYKDTKSSCSKRQIPAWLLLQENELVLFKKVIAGRDKRKKYQNQLLFNEGNSNRVINSNWVSQTFKQIMTEISNDPDYVFHHLRHTCFSIAQMIIERDFDNAISLSNYSENQVKEIYKCIVNHKNITYTAYYGLSAFAGHADTKETIGRYCHLTDFLLYSKIFHKPLPISHQEACKIFSLHPPKNGTDLNNHLLKSLERYSIVHATNTNSIEKQQIGLSAIKKPLKISLFDIQSILIDLDQRIPAKTIANNNHLNLSQIKKVENIASKIHGIAKGRKKYSPYHSARYLLKAFSVENNPALSPVLHTTNKTEVIRNKLLYFINDQLEHNNYELVSEATKAIEEALDSDNDILTIYKLEDVLNILSLLRGCLQKKYFHVTIYHNPGKDYLAKDWKKAIKSYVNFEVVEKIRIKSHKKNDIKVEFFLKDPDQKTKMNLLKAVSFYSNILLEIT